MEPLFPVSVFILAGIDVCFPAFRQEILVSLYPRGSQDLNTRKMVKRLAIPSWLRITNVQELR